jgi:hypothetical protein
LNFPTPFKLISKSKDQEFVNDTLASDASKDPKKPLTAMTKPTTTKEAKP